MSSPVTFDGAVELLEITDINIIKVEDLPTITKKLQRRWHPDRIMHSGNEAEIANYTERFQQIEPASLLIKAYLEGEYFPGEAFERPSEQEYQDPVETIRQNAPDIQARIRSVWDYVVAFEYKKEEKEVVLSDGFYWRDLLREDFADEIMSMSIVALVYGSLVFAILGLLGTALGMFGVTLVGLAYLVFALSCIAGFLPLSRFWLPDQLHNIMAKAVNFGLGIYDAIHVRTSTANPFVQLAVQIPTLAAKLVKYLIMMPLYEIAKLVVKDKKVGVVTQTYDLYAGLPRQYVEDLIGNIPDHFSEEELYDLSYLYTEFGDYEVEPA